VTDKQTDRIPLAITALCIAVRRAVQMKNFKRKKYVADGTTYTLESGV